MLPNLPLRSFAFLAAAAPLAGAHPPPSAQCTSGPASQVAALFVPDDYVPLSEFKAKSSFSGGSPATVTLHVCPDVLQWIDAATTPHIKVAIKAGGSINYYTPDTVDWSGSTGVVTLTNSFAGNCVVVSNLLLHNPTVPTHWDQGLNSGRGGHDVGATDGLRTFGYDSGTGELVEIASEPTGNTDPEWADPGPSELDPCDDNVYANATDLYALFSDGSGQHENATVPGFERYAGEGYSSFAYTEGAAIWLSDEVRERTGYPAAHRSYPDAFPECGQSPGSPPAGHAAEDSIPAFQIVHGHWVQPDEGGGSPVGYERSLAAFLLPPDWTSQSAEGTYPVIFSGFYDLNGTTFGLGPELIDAIAQVRAANTSDLAVGVLWNGGGGGAFHRSAYDNAAQLFDDAECLVKADKERMFLTGGSRGGTIALALASNPYEHDYTVTIVNARAPQVLVGTTVDVFMNPAHPGLTEVVDAYTGYKDSWKACWRDPVSEGDFRAVVLDNFFGTDDPETVDEEHSLDSELFRDGLAAEGTLVVLRAGTHDVHVPGPLMAQYVDHLIADEIPLYFELYYRFGHAVPSETQPDDAALLAELFEAEPEIPEGIQYYGTDPCNFEAYEPLSPERVLLAFEMPLATGNAQAHTWGFVGEPGGLIRVFVDDVTIDPTEGVQLGTLYLASGSPIGYGWLELSSFPQGTWYYRLEYVPDPVGAPSTFFDVGQWDGAHPTFFSLDDGYPRFLSAANETKGVLDEYARTGGVAEDGGPCDP